MHPLQEFFTKDHWLKTRNDYLEAARKCQETLISNGASQERINLGVSKWVARAKNAQAIAMGRKPALPNFLNADQDQTTFGDVYV